MQIRRTRGRSRMARRLSWLVVAALTTVALVGPGAGTAFAFTAGDNGHPTSGPYSDLKGGTATFTFQQTATLTCDKEDGASTFDFKLNYTNANLPAGAKIVVYLSPNQGAINGNAGGDEAGYVAQVESNYVVIDVGGLSGSGTLTIHLNVAHGFPLPSGGVLGVVATQADPSSVTNSKTNSLNCTDAAPTPTPPATVPPTATPTVPPTGTPTVPPTATPTVPPTATPTVPPTATPTIPPTGTPAPTETG